jgi:HK97 family phage portal protein
VANLKWWPAKGPPKLAKALSGTPEVLEGIRSGGVSPYPLLGGGSRQRILDAYNTAHSAQYGWLYRHSPAVRQVVDVIVRNIGQLDLRLYEELSESEREPRPDHPAAMSLRYPSMNVPQDKLIRSLLKDFLINDDAYALLVPAGRQITVTWLPTERMEVGGESLFDAEWYVFTRRDGTRVRFETGNILHWYGENPQDPRIGLSKLETLRNVVAEDVALQQAMVELANAGLTESVYVTRPLEAPLWSNEARAGFEEDLNNRLRRRNKIPVVLEEGMGMHGFGVSPKDAQVYEIRKWSVTQVAAGFGVPPGMLGLGDSIEEDRSQFYADTLPPYCEEFAKMLNHRILVGVYNWTDGCFEFNLDEKHMGDDRIKALVSATGRPVMLTNEGRARLNLPPVDGGDELVTPKNVSVGELPSVDVMPIQDPNGPEQDGSYREDKALVKAQEFEPVAQLHPGRKADLDRQLRNIDRAQAVIERHYQRLERAYKRRKAQPDWERWDREFAEDLNRYAADVVEKEGSIYAFKLGGVFDPDRVVEYVKAMAEGTASAINAKIRDEIRELGLDDALDRKAQHVESAGAGLGAGATRWAREEAARQSPFPESRVKVWIPNTTRHAAYAGQTVPLGSNWPAGFAPGSAPGCKCSMAID